MVPYVCFSLINTVLIDGLATFPMGILLSFGIPEILNRMPKLIENRDKIVHFAAIFITWENWPTDFYQDPSQFRLIDQQYQE
jgi:hypothetical protein